MQPAPELSFPTGTSDWINFPWTYRAANNVKWDLFKSPLQLGICASASFSAVFMKTRKQWVKKTPYWTLTVILLPGNHYNTEFSRGLDKEIWYVFILRHWALLVIDYPFHCILIVQYWHSASASGAGFPGATLWQKKKKKSKNNLASFCSTRQIMTLWMSHLTCKNFKEIFL